MLDTLERNLNIKNLTLPDVEKKKPFDIFEEITPLDLQGLRDGFRKQVEANDYRSYLPTGFALKVFDSSYTFPELKNESTKEKMYASIDGRVNDRAWYDVGQHLMHLKQIGLDEAVKRYETRALPQLENPLSQQLPSTWFYARTLMALKALGQLDEGNPHYDRYINQRVRDEMEAKQALMKHAEDDKGGFFSQTAAIRVVFPDASNTSAGLNWNRVRAKIEDFRFQDIVNTYQYAQLFSLYIANIAIATADRVQVTGSGIVISQPLRQLDAAPVLPKRRSF